MIPVADEKNACKPEPLVVECEGGKQKVLRQMALTKRHMLAALKEIEALQTQLNQ